MTVFGGELSRFVTSHPGQLSLAISPWVGAMSTSLVWEGNRTSGVIHASLTIVVYPPTGSTAYEREMSTPPTLPRSMALLYFYRFTVITATFLFIALWLVPNYTTSWQTRVKNLSRLVAWLRKDPESNPWPLDLMPYPLHRHVRLDSRYCTHPLRKYAVNQSNFIIFFSFTILHRIWKRVI